MNTNETQLISLTQADLKTCCSSFPEKVNVIRYKFSTKTAAPEIGKKGLDGSLFYFEYIKASKIQMNLYFRSQKFYPQLELKLYVKNAWLT